MRKNAAALLLPLLVLLALVAVGCRNSAAYRIGCIAPLTGEGNYGRSTRQGVELALSEINASHYLSRPLEVIFEDDRMTPREGVNALRKLISANKVPVVIGPFGSSVVLACAPIANENKTVIISASATADSIADAGDYVFRITPPNSKQGIDVANFLSQKLHLKTAAIIYQTNDYGVSLRDAFSRRFKELGGSVAAVEAVDSGATDLRAQVLRLKAANPQGIFFPLHYGESGLFLKQASDLGLAAAFISADGAMTDGTLKIAGSSAEGSYYSTLALAYGVSDHEIQEFMTHFRARYGSDTDVYAAYYYEATRIIAQALKEVGADANAIKSYLYRLHGPMSYKGITGTTSFDAKGEVDKDFLIYVVKNGHFVLADSVLPKKAI